MKDKKILKYYEDIKFGINSDPEELYLLKEQYNAIKAYFNNIISFEKLMIIIDGSCPPTSCFWCNYKCNECDLKDMDENLKCEQCWKRCLEQ